MKSLKAVVVTLTLTALTACSQSPQDRFNKICSADKEKGEATKICGCMSTELNKQLTEEKFEQLVAFMEAKKEGKQVSEDTIDGSVMGALFSAGISCSQSSQ